MPEDAQTITLKSYQYGKIGALHCGVTREGIVVVAGDQQQIEDGKQVKFDKVNVVVSRKGEEYIFAKAGK